MQAIDHLDLVVSSFDRSLDFYAGPLGQLGYVHRGEIESEPREYGYTPGY
jgi:catechol 2,3-dioxygenase-like lactoylglutathione lyase family enzyme